LIHRMRFVALVAMALALAVAGRADAKPRRVVGTTEIAVQNVFAGQAGKLSASGVLRSDVRECRSFRAVFLMRARPGEDEYMDVAFSSIRAAWGARTPRGAVEEGARFYVKAQREVTQIATIGPHGPTRRRTVVCKGARAPVVPPISPPAAGPAAR
jgi:hypothetical protein